MKTANAPNVARLRHNFLPCLFLYLWLDPAQQIFFKKHHDRIDQISDHDSDDDRLQYDSEFSPSCRKSVIAVDQEEENDTQCDH